MTEITLIVLIDNESYSSITPTSDTLYVVTSSTDNIDLYYDNRKVSNVISVSELPDISTATPNSFYLLQTPSTLSLYYSYNQQQYLSVSDSSVVAISKNTSNQLILQDHNATYTLVEINSENQLLPESVYTQIVNTLSSESIDARPNWTEWS